MSERQIETCLREAQEIMQSLELFRAWKQRGFLRGRPEFAALASKLKTEQQLERRLQAALTVVAKLPVHKQATFCWSRAQTLLGDRRW